MNATTGHTQGKVMRQITRMAKVMTPARLLRGLATGALLAAGTVLYFNMASGGEAGSPSSSIQVTEAVPAQLEAEERQAEGMSSNAVRNSTVDRKLSNIELERMDYEADMMLWAAARSSSESSPLSNKEIERLDYQIDMLRLNAMQQLEAEGKPRIFEETVLPGRYPKAADNQ
jgi:hypothetical protein